MSAPDPRELIVEELRRAFVHRFGSTRFEVWLGKDGPQRHNADDFAETAAQVLDPLLETPGLRDRIRSLHQAGELAAPLSYDPHDW
jgi:hypothetical protein